jgi:hypothetical protein
LNPKELLAKAEQAEQRSSRMTLERLLTSPSGFALPASPMQRAICRASEGAPLGELSQIPEVARAFSSFPTKPPEEVVLLSGIRTGKSLISAAAAVKASQSCDVSKLGPGEVPRVSIVSLTEDLGKVTFGHLLGNLQARPGLQRLVMGRPAGDSVMVRHPSGRPIEVRVVAGARAGASLVARWSAGVIFDEAPRMVGQEDGVVNLDDCRAATLGRMLPGSQIWYIGSPWAPFGPVWKMAQNPGPGQLVIRAPAFVMRPDHWTPERCEALRISDPMVHKTDVLAEFADPETALFASVDVDACTREQLVLEVQWGHTYFAAIDPATRGNAWTLVVATRTRDGRMVIVFNREWIGSKVQPLSPRAVFEEMAADLKPYRCTEVWSDQHSIDALRDLAEEKELELIERPADAAEKWNRYKSLEARMSDRLIELPPDPVLRADLLGVKRKVTQSGVTIVLPLTANGRHCDYAPAVTLALARYLDDPEPPPPEKGTKEFWEDVVHQQEDDEERQLRNERKRPMWGDEDDDEVDLGT